MKWKLYQEIDGTAEVEIRINQKGLFEIDAIDHGELYDWILDVNSVTTFEEAVTLAEEEFDLRLDETPIEEGE